MDTKMIVTDLDGTLLRDDKRISERTKNTLIRCRENGIKVVFASARGGSVERFAPDYLVDGKIRMNGAVAKIGDKIIYDCKIPFAISHPLLIACDKRGLRIIAEGCGEQRSIHFVNEHMHSAHFNKHQVLVDLSQHDYEYEKIIMVDLTLDDEEFITSVLPDELYFIMSKEVQGFGMIMHKDATKANAVHALAKVWDISQAEIVAFGDDVNDLDMLQYAGMGIAMANALDIVKVAANHICDTNENDGVAKWLEENVL